MTRTLSGARGGLFYLGSHARLRIRERFGIAHPAEALLWVLARMAESEHVHHEIGSRYVSAPRLVWHAGALTIVTDGNEIVTAYVEGDEGSEAAS